MKRFYIIMLIISISAAFLGIISLIFTPIGINTTIIDRLLTIFAMIIFAIAFSVKIKKYKGS